MTKPSAKKIAADRERYHQFRLEHVLGTFMNMDGARAVAQVTEWFGEPPQLLSVNGREIERAE